MARAKSLQTSYAQRPENCPHCGKHSVVGLPIEEASRLVEADSECGRMPKWQCEECHAIFFEQTPSVG